MKDERDQRDELLTTKEVGWILKLSPRTVWRLTFETDPPLPHIRIGKLVRYSIEDLSRWVESQRAGDGRKSNESR